MTRRIVYFVLTNLLVVLTISTLLTVLGANRYISSSGLDVQKLALFCAVYGFAGAFISLQISRISAKWMAGVKVIDPSSPGQYRWLLDKVHYLARQAKLPVMPQVGVYPGAEVNAFATGPSKRRSLVAVSEGLLATMNQDEIEGVLAHEVAHIQNGDMVTMALIQGVINSFVMFLSRIVAWGISQAIAQTGRDSKEEGASPMLYYGLSMVLDILFTFLGMIVVGWFSRQREFRADRGSAILSGTREKMIGALTRLGSGQRLSSQADAAPALQAFKISSSRKGFFHLFATHPPTETRIEALRNSSSFKPS
jgi:heat shock protein HtpX